MADGVSLIIGCALTLFIAISSLVILQTEIIPFANAVIEFKNPHEHSDFLQKKYIIKLQENLRENGFKIIILLISFIVFSFIIFFVVIFFI